MPVMAQHLDSHCSDTPKCGKVVEERILGLDPMFRSCVKVKVKDMQQLQLVSLQESSRLDHKIELYSFMGHIISKVEVMGIVVMSRSQGSFQSFAVDDATGVVLCVKWKITKRLSGIRLEEHLLPTSLQSKWAELQTNTRSTEDSLVCHGDLVQVRGWVTSFRGQLEIHVLDIRILDNPNVEMEAVIEYPPVFQVYRQAYLTPAAVSVSMAVTSRSTFSQQTLEEAVCSHIHSPNCSQATVTTADVIYWPSVMALFPASQGDDVNTPHEVVRSALQSLESSQGRVYKLSGTTDTYEIITASCPLAIRVMTFLRQECQHETHAAAATAGCHVQQLMSALARIPEYSELTLPVMSYLLSCLETNSDIICLAPHRYIHVS